MNERYARQVRFAGIGEEGQDKLGASRVVIAGCGALGTVSAEMLARAGVGRVRIIDRDFVEKSNLQRQSLFTEEDARDGQPKAVAAERALRSINSDITVEGCVDDLTFANIDELASGFDVIVDATDNFETRYLINDFAFKTGIPWVYGACIGSYGIACAFAPGITGCLQCLFYGPPDLGSVETCESAGILAPAVHAVASYQVSEVLRLLVGKPPSGTLLQVDIWEGSWRSLDAAHLKRADCRCCSKREFPHLQGEEKERLTRLCGRNSVQVTPVRQVVLDFSDLSRRLSKVGSVRFNEHLLRFQVEELEIALFPDGRSIIHGTEDFAEARAIYAKYIGH